MEDKLIIQTNGAREIQVRVPGRQPQNFAVPAVTKSVDPTGCGDAFLASLANDLVRQGGLNNSKRLADAIQSACRNAALCLGFNGGQRHYSTAGSPPAHA